VAIDVTARITTGKFWPDDPTGHNPVGDVLFLADEDGLADTLRPRLDAAQADVQRVHFVRGVQADDGFEMLNLQQDISRIEAELVLHCTHFFELRERGSRSSM
jgi:hypothetical protein